MKTVPSIHISDDIAYFGFCVLCPEMWLCRRPDIVPPMALAELQQLCDAVPPFSNAVAFSTIRQELGVPRLDELFDGLHSESTPVAAASLGQVYKCVMRSNGMLVAVKVQRPAVRHSVFLDLHILHQAAQFADVIVTHTTHQRPWHAAFVVAFGNLTPPSPPTKIWTHMCGWEGCHNLDPISLAKASVILHLVTPLPLHNHYTTIPQARPRLKS